MSLGSFFLDSVGDREVGFTWEGAKVWSEGGGGAGGLDAGSLGKAGLTWVKVGCEGGV